jgi:tetratricopeptide (TPR) repeat protein
VAQRFPDDSVIAALYAESLMDLHPWDFWSKQGEARPWTGEIVSNLERALLLDQDNPLANHLYIHVMEASPYVEKAIPNAERLPSLVPGSGHLVHMPAHIYIRVGRYHDAILANQQAVKVDENYLNHAHAVSIYTLAYVPHNHHFLWAAAIKTGQQALATQAAIETAAQVKPEMMREPGFSGTLQHFFVIPLYTQALFGEWDAILNEPAPAPDLLYPTGVWHYARGLALLRQGKSIEALQELKLLKQIIADPAIDTLTIFDLNSVRQILQIAAEILHGEIAAQAQKFDEVIAHFRKAVEIEDKLNYTEPKDWYLPPRQVLGAVLLETGREKEAEQTYREDLLHHPQNGWSLFGLAQSLRKQGKNKQADDIQKQFEVVWADADITLSNSHF